VGFVTVVFAAVVVVVVVVVDDVLFGDGCNRMTKWSEIC